MNRKNQKAKDTAERCKPPFAVAYIMKGFPRLSETFILREIHLLEEMGLPIRVFSELDPDLLP